MKGQRLWIGLGAFAGISILILDSRTALIGAQEGIVLCLQTVIPSLFPFFMLSNLLTGSLMGADFRILRPIGRIVEATGQFRSYNRHETGRNKLVLSVFAREIEFLESFDDYTKTNQIYLDGYICKDPIYRKTPLGREIADLLIAVNRPYGKSDYIPCIAWGRNARYASGFSVGSRIRIWGRVQSREYTKKLSETDSEKRIAYEVSVSKLEEVGLEEEAL